MVGTEIEAKIDGVEVECRIEEGAGDCGKYKVEFLGEGGRI